MQVLHDQRSIAVLRAFSAGEHDSKEWFDRKTAADRLALTSGFESLISLDSLDVALFEHQREAVLRVLREMRGRAVLADEVGLGKTVEAGVIMKEYLLRGLVRRVLVLVPASLVVQWKAEMSEKIRVEFAVGTRPESFQHNLVLASLDTAKRSENAAVIHASRWDLVIVDEAHRLKNKSTVNWGFVNAIEKKYLLLLTATPVQNDLRELYNLITLLQPGQLKTYTQFKKAFMLDRHSPKNLHHLRELLGEVMVRRSRRETLIRFPRREVRSLSVPLAAEETRFYQRMLEVLGEAYRSQPIDKRNMLPFLLLLRETCSHPWAARRTLEAMVKSPPRICVLQPEQLQELISICPSTPPAKLSLALDFLAHLKERAIVFTEFRVTQEALLAACAASGIKALPFHGGMPAAEKEEAINRFRRRGGVLVSTECGSEGRNLQFCRTMVNYDLPWNPMRLEQRIGRIHRLGQVRDVLVVNLITEGTVEAYLLYLLERKISMFTKVIGEIEAVLANLPAPYERVLAHMVLDACSEADMAERFASFGRELEQACQTYEGVHRLNEQLFSTDPDTVWQEA